MKFISHRGNIEKIIKNEENNPKKISECLTEGYEVEIDVWYTKGQLYLGHDYAQYLISETFLITNKDKFWCHAKNKEALLQLLKFDVNCFWHQTDSYTLTSKNNIWVFPNMPLLAGSIAVMPENSSYTDSDIKFCSGICSDYIKSYKTIYGD